MATRVNMRLPIVKIILCLIGNLSAELGNASETCRLMMKQASEAWRKRYIVLLTKAQEQGLVRKDISAAAMANMLWAAWQGGLLQMKIDGNTLFLKQDVDLAMDALFRQPWIPGNFLTYKNRARGPRP